MARSSKLPSLRLFLSLAIGVLAIWAVVVVMASDQLNSSVAYQETLGVDVNGQLIIESYSTAGGVYRPLPRRDLEGRKVDAPYSSLVQSASLPAGPTRRGLLDGPINWSERLMWTRTEMMTAWYLVRDGAPEGRAYIVGFDENSSLPMQYAGPNGFSPTLPEESQRFEIGGPFGYSSQHVVGSAWSGGRYFSSVSQADDDSATPLTTLFLLDGDDLMEINPRTSSVRKVMEATDPISLAIVTQPVAGDSTNMKQTTAPDGVVTNVTPMATRLALRTRANVFIIDPRQQSEVEFKLPADLQTVGFDVYSLSPEKLLIDRAKRDDQGEVEHHLTWIEAGKDAVSAETVTTRGSGIRNMRAEAVIGAIVIPTLAILLPLMFSIVPATLLQTHEAATLFDAYSQTLSASWPAALGLAIFSLLAACLVLRWERKHGRPHPWRWAVATFLLGVPGFIAYVILYGRKSLAAPRRERPATPALLGTELFA